MGPRNRRGEFADDGNLIIVSTASGALVVGGVRDIYM